MYLQSLEMLGFKSFAPKTILQFNRGVTAIVGPNGCGKSNVLDALRWVLGEQSAKALRGGEMADVIFSGTDSRPALGMAEVSLTFADCEKELGVEWNEVRVTRRIFRDGKSEYLLNKTPCRLRDIHELFMDTGIGRSAYSIMEQGKIDLILSSRPEDRRAIFEEAAGITKYKAQKKEALRKLEYTESNLIRVADIIKEVKRQIGSLQRQAGKARRYQALLQDLRTFDLHLSHRNYRSFSEELTALRGEIRAGELSQADREAALERMESQLSELRASAGELSARAEETRGENQNLRNRIFAAENRIQGNAERTREITGLIERHQGDVERAEERIQEQRLQMEQTEQMIREVLEALQHGEGELRSRQERAEAARRDLSASEREVLSVHGAISTLETQISNLGGEISSATSRREGSLARLEMLRQEVEQSAARAREAVERLQAAETESERSRCTLLRTQEELDAAKLELEEAQAARQQVDSQWNSLQRSVAEQQSRLDVLRQLQAEGEGFSEGTQAVLRGLDNPDFFKPAVLGVLASFMDVQPRFIPAIEAALGSNLQAIVFKDPTAAESALLTLEARKLGRASLVPRDWIQPVEELDQPSLPEGALAWALDCVKASGEAAPLVRQLLTRVAVVENLEIALRLRRQFPGIAFATLGSQHVSREGIVTGGQGGSASSSALTRQIQVQELERELASLHGETEQCASRREQVLSRLEMAQARQGELREQVQEAQVAVSTARSRLESAARERSEAERRRESLEREMGQLREGLQGSEERLQRLESQLADVRQQLASRRSDLSQSQTRVEALRASERETADELNAIRLQVATEKQRQESLARQRQPMEARVAELVELIAQRRHEVSSYGERLERIAAENVEFESGIQDWQVLLETGEQVLSQILTEQAGLSAQIEEKDRSLREARREVSSLQEARGKLEVRCTQIELRLEAVCEHARRRYQTEMEEFRPDTYALLCALRDREKKSRAGDEVGAETAPATAESESLDQAEAPEPSQEIPWNRIEQYVAELTEKIDSMGPVNLEAIQEYDELEERYTFLEQQNADLSNAKAELLDVIAKINRTTREVFAETFEKVRINFQEMFNELFGGGKANLLLADESDPLESGIEIIAKPPGKQLQSISLLSGGEKTMTAVALLFSIYMVKPSPFCVLDEMDAPLDESNISRFIKILDRFVGQSQFVVITHNKRTIGRADMLYGVTMEEHGVSKLVSVQFRHREMEGNPKAGNGKGGGRSNGNGNGHHHETQSVAESFGKSGDLASERRGLVAISA